MTPEQWRPIAGYAGIYEVSDQGRVRSLDRVDTYSRRRRGRVRRLALCVNTGYLGLTLYGDGAGRPHKVHRLVADAFLPLDSERRDVNHLSGNKTDNRLSNLERATRAENVAHAVATGLWGPRVSAVVGRRVADGEERRFESISAAARGTGTSHGNIQRVLRGTHTHAKGYEWRRA